MPRRLTTVITDFSTRVRDFRRLASDAYTWSVPIPPATTPLINAKRRNTLTELAFFRVFSAWEAFLEETFILYMLGQQAPRGRKKVHRYGFPPNEDAAYAWVAGENRYANWNPDKVSGRAKRFFKDGGPFLAALTSQQNLLSQMKSVRNAIAHDSEDARKKFEAVVRNELGALPPNTTAGSFLLATKPKTAPPVSFLEFYFDELVKVARKIVPA